MREDKKEKPYRDYLIERLKDPREAAAYLNAAIEDGDPEIFLGALRNVAEARGGLSSLSRKTKLNRSNLYKILSKKGHPEIQSVVRILNSMDLQLAVSAKSDTLKKAA